MGATGSEDSEDTLMGPDSPRPFVAIKQCVLSLKQNEGHGSAVAQDTQGTHLLPSGKHLVKTQSLCPEIESFVLLLSKIFSGHF